MNGFQSLKGLLLFPNSSVRKNYNYYQSISIILESEHLLVLPLFLLANRYPTFDSNNDSPKDHFIGKK